MIVSGGQRSTARAAAGRSGVGKARPNSRPYPPPGTLARCKRRAHDERRPYACDRREGSLRLLGPSGRPESQIASLLRAESQDSRALAGKCRNTGRGKKVPRPSKAEWADTTFCGSLTVVSKHSLHPLGDVSRLPVPSVSL